MGKASIECAEVTSRWRIFATHEGLGPQREAAVASQPAPNSLGYYVVRLKTVEEERQIKMNLWDLTRAFNNLHAAITESILLSFWEIRGKGKSLHKLFYQFHRGPFSIPIDAARLNSRENETKKVVGFETSRMIAPFFGGEALKYDEGAYWEARASELMSQLWRQASIVSSWQVASAMAHRDDKKRGECGPSERKRKNHSFRSDCSVRCFGCAFLLCADFIDYMKRIQIAAQECNIRFLNPIVGAPEKRAPRCGYIHNIL